MAVAFSDTTNKNGLIEICERLCHLGDAGISGDATLLKQFTSSLNNAYDEIMPLVFASEGRWQFDDHNHTDMPEATTNIVSGQRDYSFTSDTNGNSILSISKVAIKQDASTSDYTLIKPLDQNDARARRVIENNSSNAGVPSFYDKTGNSILLDPNPNYSATAGLKITFLRTPNYFVSTDTTQTPGIPDMFHMLLAQIASHEWMFVNEPNEGTTITRLEDKIQSSKIQLEKYMSNRSKDESKRLVAAYMNPA